MGLNQVSSGNAGELAGELFAGNHGPEGVWQSEKGTALAAPELSYYDQDGNVGPDRLNQEVNKSDWRKTGPVESGTFDPNSLTRGTDKHMPR
jgi:hypothetical protein